MPTPTLKYVAPATPEAELTFAPEPVVIYGVPGGGDSGIQSIVAGTNVTVDSTDPYNPIVSATGGGGGGAVDSVNGQTGVVVLDIPETPEDIGAATAAQGTLASTAVQPAALSAYVPTTRTVAGKALSANVTLVKGDVGLGSVDNTSDASKPISTATQTALNGKATTAQGALADTAVQPSNPRLPLVMTQAAYNAITPVAGQVYVIQG